MNTMNTMIGIINKLKKYLDEIEDVDDNLSDVESDAELDIKSGKILYQPEIQKCVEHELQILQKAHKRCLNHENNQIKLQKYSELVAFYFKEESGLESEEFCMKWLNISLKKKQEILLLYTDKFWRKNQSDKMYYEYDIENYKRLLITITDIDSTEIFKHEQKMIQQIQPYEQKKRKI